MRDPVAPPCVNVIPDAADTAFQIHRMKRSAYTAVLRSFYTQSDRLSGAKEECLAQLRKEFKILEIEHRECLVEARSNKQMKYLSVGMSKGNTCNNEVMKDTPDLGFTVPEGDTVFQIHCLERSAYASVLRAFGAVTNHLSLLQVKNLAKLRNELRVSNIEHKEVLAKVISDEHIKSLRKFSLANCSVHMNMDASFHAQSVVHDKITSKEQLSTSSTSCLSLVQKSPIPEGSMPSIRDDVILDSSSGDKEGSCFESHVAKRLRSVCELVLSYLDHPPSVEQLPVASYTVMSKGCTDDTIDRETLSCEVKAECTISPNLLQGSRKRKIEVPVMSGSKSHCVIDTRNEIYNKHRNKESNLEHGSEIFKIRMTANLLDKVEKLFKRNPDPANLNTAKSMLRAHEKDLLDALAKLAEASIDVDGLAGNEDNALAGKADGSVAVRKPRERKRNVRVSGPEWVKVHARVARTSKQKMDLVPNPEVPDRPHSDNSGGGGAVASPSRYESLKCLDWNKFGKYLRYHRPPLSLAQCSGAQVLEFLRYLDQSGQTKMHTGACPFFGHPAPPAPCPCPLRQAWVSLDALVRRLRAAYEENGGQPESNPFGARAVRLYLREVRDHQSLARRVIDKKNRPQEGGGAYAARRRHLRLARGQRPQPPVPDTSAAPGRRRCVTVATPRRKACTRART